MNQNISFFKIVEKKVIYFLYKRNGRVVFLIKKKRLFIFDIVRVLYIDGVEMFLCVGTKNATCSVFVFFALVLTRTLSFY